MKENGGVGGTLSLRISLNPKRFFVILYSVRIREKEREGEEEKSSEIYIDAELLHIVEIHMSKRFYISFSLIIIITMVIIIDTVGKYIHGETILQEKENTST